jgi:hypothetical protein
MSHKLVIVREEGGIFTLPDKSPTITIDKDGMGCYKAENLTNDGRTNNVIASPDYIGIYIVPVGGFGGTGSQIKDPIEIEGTIYLRFDNTDLGRNASTEVSWPH